MKDIACSCTATELGFASREGYKPAVDANRVEQNFPSVMLTCLPKSDKIINMATAGRIHQDRLGDLLQAASNGCHELHGILENVIREHVKKLAATVDPTS